MELTVPHTRRQFIKGVGAGALIVGYDLTGRRWVTAAEAGTPGSFAGVAPLDGTLSFDTTTRANNAHDEGNIVTHSPAAVLLPGSVSDIQKMVRFCGVHDIQVAASTGKNSTFGQTLVGGGLAIDMRTLNTIHSISAAGADVDAGVLWFDLLGAATAQGFTPPAITGYTQLGVSGTLSIGGLNAINSNRLFPQVSYVQQLQVVTGAGDLVWCSPSSNRALFAAVCAGLGQCAVIVRAVIDVIPAPQLARLYVSNPYSDLATCLSDLRTLANRGGQPGGFDWVASINTPGAGLSALLGLKAVVFYNPGSPPPPTATLMAGCSATAQAAQSIDLSYLDYVRSVDATVNGWRSSANWDSLVKPWFNGVIPDNGIDAFAGAILPTLTDADVSPTTYVLLGPGLASSFTSSTPLFRAPSPQTGTWAWIVGILTTSAAPGPDPTFAAAMVARNYRWWHQAAAIGGFRYVEDAVPFTKADWQRHYGSALYAQFAAWKQQFDPHGILAPGPGIF